MVSLLLAPQEEGGSGLSENDATKAAQRALEKISASGEASIQARAADTPPPVDVNRLALAFAADLKPLRDRLERILQIEDPEIFRLKLEAFRDALPELLQDINADPESARVMEDSLQTGFLAGVRAVPKPKQ